MRSSRRSGSFRKAERAAAAGLFLLALFAAGAARGARNPHAFMEEQSRCLGCHAARPIQRAGPFVKDIVNLCMDCHSVAHRMSHPVDIRPQSGISANLPVDAEGTMTCATCHDPHSEPFSAVPYVRRGLIERLKGMFSSTGYRTFFLRVPNTEGGLCLSCHSSQEVGKGFLEVPTEYQWDYTGSKACERCHREIYEQWTKTPHARSVSDPRQDPAAVRAVFSGDESFRPADVEMAIGVHWTQRYVIVREGTLRIARGVWSLTDRKWTRSTWREQPWSQDCAGCHLTGYDPYSDNYVERGVGCEMCHGPGGGHVRSRKAGDIVNPAGLDWRRSSSICASCHTNGHDRTGEFRYPVGYLPGTDLAEYYRGLLPHIGQGVESFKGDGTLEDRLGSFAFWVENFLNPSRFQCKQCKGLHVQYARDVAEGRVDLTLAKHCLSCHEEIHNDARHGFASVSDVDCHSCHQPLQDKLGRPSIHDHRFVFR